MQRTRRLEWSPLEWHRSRRERGCRRRPRPAGGAHQGQELCRRGDRPLVGRPCQIGHVGKWIAARIFDIELHESAVAPGSDGVFRSGPLVDRSVNVKWYGLEESILDMHAGVGPDTYPCDDGSSVRHRQFARGRPGVGDRERLPVRARRPRCGPHGPPTEDRHGRQRPQGAVGGRRDLPPEPVAASRLNSEQRTSLARFAPPPAGSTGQGSAPINSARPSG